MGVGLASFFNEVRLWGQGGERDRAGGLAEQRGGRAFIHLRSRIPDIVYLNDSVTTRAFVPCIDLMWFYTLCWHLGDLQLTLFSLFKGEDLWFFVSGEEVSHSVSHSPV